jgi:hypothetical protein
MPLEAGAARLAGWGFLATPDLPDRPGPARLLIAIRQAPTLLHYDPERVEFWVAPDGRGRRRTIDWETRMPLTSPFSWGPVRIGDRFGVTNDYLSFGGRLRADLVGDIRTLVFESPAPILRRGGHSQPWDPGAAGMGAFFARLLVPVGATLEFEARVNAAAPLVRYAAFVADFVDRCRRHAQLRVADAQLWVLLGAEERRLRRDHPAAWRAGAELLATGMQDVTAS